MAEGPVEKYKDHNIFIGNVVLPSEIGWTKSKHGKYNVTLNRCNTANL